MRKMVLCVVIVVVSAFMLTGCAGSMSPVAGMLYTDASGFALISGNASTVKVGKTMCTSYFGMVGVGDCSIQTAAKNGNIKKIHHVDYHNSSILGWAKIEVSVYGE